MRNKSKLSILLILVAVCSLAVFFSGCKKNAETSEDESYEIVWVDGVTPDPEPDPSVTSPAVKYPEKPSEEPTVDPQSPTQIGALTASDECYTLETVNEGVKISYDSLDKLPNFAYVYAPVSNFQAKYQYLKIKANCVGVQKITVIAVYYEQYGLNRPGVTVYNNAVIEGENTIICDINESVILDDNYGVVIGEKLTEKKICGFMITIDSNPKQVIDDFKGEMTITSIGLVDSSDEDLSLLTSAPIISGWSTLSSEYTRCNIEQAKSEKTGSMNAVIDYSFTSGYPYVVANIFNYKSEYTTLKFKMKGENVKNLSVAMKYSLTSSATSTDYNYLVFGMQVPTDFETVEFDFGTLEELTNDFTTTIPGSYVKNLKPVALYFFIDTDTSISSAGGDGKLYIEDVEFVKVVEDGTPKVTSTWTITGSGMTKSNVVAGGIGTLTYTQTQGWTPVTINVSSYNPEYTTLVIKVKFYGAKNIGVALGYGSSNAVIQNSDGDTMGNIVLNHTEENGTDDKGDYVFHTYEIDFAQMQTMNGEALKDQAINKIMFYIDAVQVISGNTVEVAQGSTITERIMQFVSIEFKKPEAEA